VAKAEIFGLLRCAAPDGLVEEHCERVCFTMKSHRVRSEYKPASVGKRAGFCLKNSSPRPSPGGRIGSKGRAWRASTLAARTRRNGMLTAGAHDHSIISDGVPRHLGRCFRLRTKLLCTFARRVWSALTLPVCAARATHLMRSRKLLLLGPTPGVRTQGPGPAGSMAGACVPLAAGGSMGAGEKRMGWWQDSAYVEKANSPLGYSEPALAGLTEEGHGIRDIFDMPALRKTQPRTRGGRGEGSPVRQCSASGCRGLDGPADGDSPTLPKSPSFQCLSDLVGDLVWTVPTW